jgi:hypothetical protein
MKKILPTFIVSISVCGFNLYGNESATGMISNFKKNPNHIYFGPEIFAFDLNSHFKNVRVHGSKLFLGLRLGYEYLKPEAFYFGIDIMAAGANHGFHESFREHHVPQSNGLTGFGNFELRFGYTFTTNSWLATPFLCLGGYSFGSGNHHHHFDEGISYLGGGVRSRYEISQIFNLGLNIKIFGSIYTDEKFRFLGIKQTNHNGLWGGEFGLPLFWRIGSHKRWDIQLEPYFLKLDFSEVQNIYGTRLLFGYCF